MLAIVIIFFLRHIFWIERSFKKMKQIISFKKEVAFKTMIADISSISLEHTLHFTGDSSVEGDLLVSGTYKMTEATTLEEPFNYTIPVDIMLTTALEKEDRLIAIDNFTYRIINEEVLELNVDILIRGLEKVEIIEEEEEKVEAPIDVIEVEPEQLEIEEQPALIAVDTRKAAEEEEAIPVSVDRNEVAATIEMREALESFSPPSETLESKEDIADKQAAINALAEEWKEQESPVETVETTTKEETIPVMNSIFSAFANTDETYSTYSVYIMRPEDNLEEVMMRYGITREDLSHYNDLENVRPGSKLIIPTVDANA